MTQGRNRRAAIRLIAGLAISAFFIVVTISRVDLTEVGAALGRVDFGVVLLAIPIVAFELVLRALRWQRLLQPIGAVTLTRTGAYLAIGYFANSMLPARLGDVARAFLAGRAFGISRLAVLGTIVVERLADGVFILFVVAVLGLTVAGGASLANTALLLTGLAVVGLLTLAAAIIWLRRPRPGRFRARVQSLVERVLLGVQSVRTPSIAITTGALTVAAFGASVAIFTIVANAAGAGLSLGQCALVMGGLALSTSIPAGPGSIGTYEFVGLTIMTSLGVDPELAVAVVLLVHLVATIPPALVGLVATWRLHFRFSELAADSDPGVLGAPEAS